MKFEVKSDFEFLMRYRHDEPNPFGTCLVIIQLIKILFFSRIMARQTEKKSKRGARKRGLDLAQWNAGVKKAKVDSTIAEKRRDGAEIDKGLADLELEKQNKDVELSRMKLEILAIEQETETVRHAKEESMKELDAAKKDKEVIVQELDGMRKEVLEVNRALDSLRKRLESRTKLLQMKKGMLAISESRVQAVCNKVKRKFPVLLTEKLKTLRLKNPTSVQTPEKELGKRRRHTMEVAHRIHGGSKTTPEPTLHGIFQTLCAQESIENLVKRIVAGKRGLVKALEDHFINGWLDRWSSSDENVLKSVHTFYVHSVASKRKYEGMRNAGKVVFEGFQIPNFVPYQKMISHIRSLDLGSEPLDVNPTLTTDKGCKSASGMYRNAREYIPELAQFYLTVNKWREDKLHVFPNLERMKQDPESFLFLICFGGDHAPVCGTNVLLSFLNVGERIASSDENWILLGTDEGEESDVVRNYLYQLVDDIEYLLRTVIKVEVDGKVRKVEFQMGELPNDMKMLCFLGGELSNNAHYFTTFANVNKHDLYDKTKVFGTGSDADWKPWDYQKRISDSNLAKRKKEELAMKSVTDQTKRSKAMTKMTSF